MSIITFTVVFIEGSPFIMSTPLICTVAYNTNIIAVRCKIPCGIIISMYNVKTEIESDIVVYYRVFSDSL